MNGDDRKKYWQAHDHQIVKAEQAKAKLTTDQEKIWKKAKAEYLIVNHCCVDCAKRGFISIADQVVHVDEPNNNPIKFWNIQNWKAVCLNCFALCVVPLTIPGVIRKADIESLYTVK